MQITIPFQEEFRKPMLEGLKCVTTRTKKYGPRGATFFAFGTTFKILEVYRCQLRHVAEKLYKGEGFDSPKAFIECWKRLHPRKGYVPDQKVYTHLFALARRAEPLAVNLGFNTGDDESP